VGYGTHATDDIPSTALEVLSAVPSELGRALLNAVGGQSTATFGTTAELDGRCGCGAMPRAL
jgi:hypothetical protein